MQLIADVSGWFAAGTVTAPGCLSPVTPARVLDTRNATGGTTGPVGAGQTVKLKVLGAGGVPKSGVEAVVLNVTVTQPTAGGYVTVYPDGVTRPTTSNLNYVAGQTIPNLVIAPVGTDGEVDLYNGSSGKAQLIADVSGWFAAGAPTTGGLMPLTPARLLDTRGATGGTAGPVGAGQTVGLKVLGAGGVPASGVEAVVLNVTVTQPKVGGFVTVYPDGVTRPTTSNLNYVAGQTIPNLVIAPVGADGKVDLYNGSGGTVQIVADVSGYFTSGPVTPLGGVATLASDGAGYCAVLTAGGVDCWGDNTYGQVGNGTSGGLTDLPAPVEGPGGTGTLGGVASVASDKAGYCAVLTSGGVDCWGDNTYGQLGIGNDNVGRSDIPVAVAGIGRVGTLSGVARLEGAFRGYCAVLTSGGVDCWGDDTYGQLGDGNTTGQYSPVAVVGVGDIGTLTGVTAMATDSAGYCAVLTSGGVDCWGDNTDGELGDSGTLSSDSPVAVVARGGTGSLSSVASVVNDGSSGEYCAVLTTGGVDCWGANANGSLGDGSTSGPDGCVVPDCTTAPVAVVGVGDTGVLAGVGSLVADATSYCAVLTAGGVDCWGDGVYGELGSGNGAPLDSPSPVQVVGVGGSGTLNGVTGAISAGTFDVCVQFTSGNAACWGLNLLNQQEWTPIPAYVAGVGGSGLLTGAASLASDGSGSCAVLTSGGVDCWGSGAGGDLGDGTLNSSPDPVAVDQIG